jgi:predicted acyl esterase
MLYDQYPAAGPAIPVADSIMRLSHYLEENELGPVVPNTEYVLNFRVGQRAYNFESGHQIGLLICSTNFPRFDINPGNGEAFFDILTAETLDTSLREGGPEPSSLTLQTIPQDQ